MQNMPSNIVMNGGPCLSWQHVSNPTMSRDSIQGCMNPAAALRLSTCHVISATAITIGRPANPTQTSHLGALFHWFDPKLRLLQQPLRRNQLHVRFAWPHMAPQTIAQRACVNKRVLDSSEDISLSRSVVSAVLS